MATSRTSMQRQVEDTAGVSRGRTASARGVNTLSGGGPVRYYAGQGQYAGMRGFTRTGPNGRKEFVYHAA
jgi:hypothetical protein